MVDVNCSAPPALSWLTSVDSELVENAQASAQLVNTRTNAFSQITQGTPDPDGSGDSPMVWPDRPLSGALVSVKDSFHVAGMRRWHGSATHSGAASTDHSIPVRRLLASGATIIAKTSMPDFGLLASGLSSQYGTIRNPWNTSFSPGGSSSGAGVAVATGVTPLALGTDIAGSVRLPAAHCGISAMKPTQGAVPYTPASTWRSAGPMAKTVGELRNLFKVICNSDPYDQLSFNTSTGAELPSLRHANVGVLEWPGYGDQMDEDTSRVFSSTLRVLEQEGARLSLVEPGITEADFSALDRCLKARCISELKQSPPCLSQLLLPQVEYWAQDGCALSASDYYTDFEHLSSVASRLNALFSSYDFIVAPVIGTHAFPAESFGPDESQPLLYHTNFTAWFNQTGQPAVSIPAGLSKIGMPVGIQIVGPRFSDLQILDLSESIEALLNLDLNYPTAIAKH
ncbi:amidase [Brevibacterium luteolum]|uniref:Amidase n=1 Tax=Brevibacterium luteolum TaxID=199591 RepID=A0A6G8KZT8_9MICO|nr:amidase [Brevibacterium luteolum]